MKYEFEIIERVSGRKYYYLCFDPERFYALPENSKFDYFPPKQRKIFAQIFGENYELTTDILLRPDDDYYWGLSQHFIPTPSIPIVSGEGKCYYRGCVYEGKIEYRGQSLYVGGKYVKEL